MHKKLTYDSDKECPLCLKMFKVTRTRTGIKLIGMDTDFRMKYEGVDPNYYIVWVCPHCGYAAQDNCFAPLSERERALVLKALKGKDVGIDLQGERTWEQAVASYKLAIYFGEKRELPASRMAGLYLKMAWLFRDKQEAELEQRCLVRAAEYYDKAYCQENFPIGKMTENTVIYLLANILNRTGEYKQAAKWLSKIIGRKNIKEPKILKMAQDLWGDIKEKRARAELEQSQEVCLE